MGYYMNIEQSDHKFLYNAYRDIKNISNSQLAGHRKLEVKF